MGDTILGGLTLAAISGLAFIAYKHPQFYRRVAWAVAGLAAIIFLLIKIYNYGVRQAMSVFRAQSPELAAQAVQRLIDHSDFMEKMGWVLLLIVCAAAVLSGLPKLLRSENKKEKSE